MWEVGVNEITTACQQAPISAVSPVRPEATSHEAKVALQEEFGTYWGALVAL